MRFNDTHRLYKNALKIRSVVKSCQTTDQLKSAIRMSENMLKNCPECDQKHIINLQIQTQIMIKISEITTTLAST